MIDNFLLISEIISKKDLSPGDFFFLEIIARKKDNPDQETHARVIKDYYIKDAEHLNKLKDEIISLCNLFNARAYFRLNKRNKKTIALKSLALVAENISTEQYDIKNCYSSCCGKYHSDIEKTWVIDFDFDVTDKEQYADMTYNPRVSRYLERQMNYMMAGATSPKNVCLKCRTISYKAICCNDHTYHMNVLLRCPKKTASNKVWKKFEAMLMENWWNKKIRPTLDKPTKLD